MKPIITQTINTNIKKALKRVVIIIVNSTCQQRITNKANKNPI